MCGLLTSVFKIYLCLLCCLPSGHDASQITLALGTAAAYPRACQALGAMLSKGALNPADITVLFKMFSSMDPPPVELVRVHFGPATPRKIILSSLWLPKENDFFFFFTV